MLRRRLNEDDSIPTEFSEFVHRFSRDIRRSLRRCIPYKSELHVRFQREIYKKYTRSKLSLCAARHFYIIGHRPGSSHGLSGHSCCIDVSGWSHYRRRQYDLLGIIPTPIIRTDEKLVDRAFIKQTILMCARFTSCTSGLKIAEALMRQHSIKLTDAECRAYLQRAVESELIYVKFQYEVYKACVRRRRELMVKYQQISIHKIEEKMTELRNVVSSSFNGDPVLIHSYIDLIEIRRKTAFQRHFFNMMTRLFWHVLTDSVRRYKACIREPKSAQRTEKLVRQILTYSGVGIEIPIKLEYPGDIASQIDLDNLPSIDQYLFSNCELITRIYAINPTYLEVLRHCDEEYKNIPSFNANGNPHPDENW